MRPKTAHSSEYLSALRAKLTLTLAEAAALIGCGESALRGALRRGQIELPVISIGARRVVPTAAVMRLLEREA